MTFTSRCHMQSPVFACVVLAVIAVACSERESVLERARSDNVATVSPDDRYMEEAFAKARSTLDDFLTAAKTAGPGTADFAVKVAISDQGNTEYFWILPFTVEDDAFSGPVNNTPRLVSTVREGEVIRFRRSDIVDWTYQDTAAGKMRGNFTACALLKHESPTDAAQFQKEYGLDCGI